MVDNRIYTFLELCDVMHYRKTAENLQMTQPAVTQHIQYLEQQYQCKLFHYANKQLRKTQACLVLERYARRIVSMSLSAGEAMDRSEQTVLRIGATKTIGEYTMDEALCALVQDHRYQVHLTVDNTAVLLDKLNHFALDVLLLEGHVDKAAYSCRPISGEKIVGICALGHPFAGREVALEEVLGQSVALREQGSGTRAVFEGFLHERGYSIDAFANKTFISSNRLIELVVERQAAISFVYDVIPKKNKKIATFTIEGSNLCHGFTYVFLNETKANEIITLLEEGVL